MTLKELREAFRARAADEAEPWLWSNKEIALFLNEAQCEACERAHLVADAVAIELEAGKECYPLPPDVLKVLSARTPAGALTPGKGRHDLGSYFESQDGMLWVKAPLAAQTLALIVSRLPAPMEQAGDTPEIHARYHYRLLDWAMRCAYLKQDAETFNAKTAAFHQALFEQSFGGRPDANVQRKQREAAPTVVRYGGM
jgi:hypothetical protein